MNGGDPLRTLPVAFDRAERLAKTAGGVGLVVTLVFGAMNLDQLLRSYLFAFLFFNEFILLFVWVAWWPF